MSANSSYSPALLEADEAPFAAEFLRHPDYRVTAGFLLGWVFWSSFYNTHQSRFFQQIGRVLWCFLRGKRDSAYANDVEAWAPKDEKCQGPDESGQTSIPPPISNETALAFTLNLCFSFASFAKFCSILAYDPGGANTVCVRGTRRAEFLSLCAALVIALSFVLAFNATNTGDVVPIGSLMVAICVVDRYVPTAILTSATSVFLELYMVIRNLSWEDRTAGLFYMLRRSANLRVAQASSLLLIDVLTVAPKVTNTNVLAQFVPFSLGALIVLIAFNRRAQDKTQVDSAPGGPSKGRSRRQTPGPLTLLSRSPPHPTVDSSPASSEKGDVIAIDTPMGQPCLVHSTRTASPVIVPSSAPPRIGDAPVFSDLQANQILPFQTQYAERLERHIHTGPIVPLRPKRQRPHIQVVVEDMELVKASPLDRAPSTIIGSDIIRLPSAVAAARKGRKAWSSGSAMTPSDSTNGTSSAATPTTTVRDSNLSMATSAFSRSAGGSRSILSGVLSRQASQKARSPAETSLRMPWRSAPRASFASGRTFGGREELPAVTEGRSKGVGAGLSTGSWRHSQSSAKRLPSFNAPRHEATAGHLCVQPPQLLSALNGTGAPTVPHHRRVAIVNYALLAIHRSHPDIGLVWTRTGIRQPPRPQVAANVWVIS
ncbi:hypothetical protein BN946_scf184858.g23 [Trametes cinnabarina]|uniref:Uncharacterized protein n=1 Tax=Pycnoporus cinnabarinus TaxID=5643 RepID=A0A060SSY3_PYCCI|nr:hypothetical protein BN946_scf184858.g23 [Trametes cinnabarina]